MNRTARNSCTMLLMAAISALSGGSGPAQAAEAQAVSIGGDIGIASQYVARGLSLTSGNVAVQGDLAAVYGGFSASVWFSNAYVSPEPQFVGKDVVEFDLTAAYAGNAGDVGYSVGGIYYTYLYDAHSNFVEAYAGLSYDAMVSPSLTVYYTARGVSSTFYKQGDVWVDPGAGRQYRRC